MPKDPAKTKQERGIYRGQITKKVKTFRELMLQQNYDQAQLVLSQIEQNYSKMVEFSDAFRDSAELNETDYETDVMDDLKYSDVVCEVKTRWEQYKTETPRPQAPADPVVPYKPEPLPVPEFSGDRSEFSNFWTVFKHRIDRDVRLQDRDKHAYLLSKLKGAAKDAIAGIPVAAGSGYTRAKTILLNRFGKKVTLINDCMSHILSAPVYQDCSPTDVRALSDSLNLHVRTLEALGVQVEQCAPVLSPILLSKIPVTLRSRFYEQHGDGVNSTIDTEGYTPPPVDSILTFLSTQAETAELSEPIAFSMPEASGMYSKPKYTRPPRRKSAIATLEVQTEEGKSHSRQAYRCPVCSAGDHPIRKCPQYQDMTPEERYKLVQKITLCFNCLSHTHRVPQCSSLTSCFRCQARHHTTLCRQSNVKTSKTPSNTGNQIPKKTSKPGDNNAKSETVHVQS